MARKPPRNSLLRLNDVVYIQDEEDSGDYSVGSIDEAEGDCWLYADIPEEDDPESTRSVEQQFPLSWIEEMFANQNEEEWDRRKAERKAEEEAKEAKRKAKKPKPKKKG